MLDKDHPLFQYVGKHLKDLTTGQIWPWTEYLSKKDGFVLCEQENADKPKSWELKPEPEKKSNKFKIESMVEKE